MIVLLLLKVGVLEKAILICSFSEHLVKIFKKYTERMFLLVELQA